MLGAASVIYGCQGQVSVRTSLRRSSEVRETTQKLFKADRIKTVKVLSEVGDITILTDSTQQNVKINAEKIVRGSASEAALQQELSRLKPTAHLEGDTLVLETQMTPLSAHRQGFVNYTLMLPRSLAVRLQNASGDVNVSDLHSSVWVKTASGNVRIAGVTGNVDVSTASGDLQLHSLSRCPQVLAKTESGEVHAEEVEADDYQSETVSGTNQFVGAAKRLSLRTVSGEIALSLSPGASPEETHAETVSGSVSAVLSKELKGTLDLSTVSGDFDLSAFLSEGQNNEDRHALRLPINGGGGAAVILRTTSGDIKAELRK